MLLDEYGINNNFLELQEAYYCRKFFRRSIIYVSMGSNMWNSLVT
jgi:hypothetical protein